ncbi:SWIM zinc finger family protein [Candidatus Bathyarchaeota archaeon]|nr:SWIM zinc finger family protein [Candidatus Bathyarchaeota archaeon]
MYVEVMIDKALRLLESGRVERLDGDRYNVIGNHGTYSVVARDGKVTCTCAGFQSRRRCSHSSAVTILRSRRRGKS